jgi:hypothetical protein
VRRLGVPVFAQCCFGEGYYFNVVMETTPFIIFFPDALLFMCLPRPPTGARRVIFYPSVPVSPPHHTWQQPELGQQHHGKYEKNHYAKDERHQKNHYGDDYR